MEEKYKKRCYGNRVGNIIHRVMELSVKEWWTGVKKADEECKTRLSLAEFYGQGKLNVDSLIRMAVWEELMEGPLTDSQREQMGLNIHKADVGADFDECYDAIKGYANAFVQEFFSDKEVNDYLPVEAVEAVYTEMPMAYCSSDSEEEVVLLNGIADLVVCFKDESNPEYKLKLLDYKTSRQLIDESDNDYANRIQDKYSSQLSQYQSMLANIFQVDADKIDSEVFVCGCN